MCYDHYSLTTSTPSPHTNTPPSPPLLTLTSSLFISLSFSLYLLDSLAIAIQAQVYDDHAAAAELPELYPEFGSSAALDDLLTRNEGEFPGVAARRMSFDMSLKIRDGTVPSLNVVYSFLVECYNKKHYSDECNIIAIIYLYRMLSPNLPLSVYNWRGLWVVAIIVAQKMWSDSPLKTSGFVALLPGVSKRQLSQMEIKAMELLNYTVGITPSQYAQYYFQLRKILKEARGGGDSVDGSGAGGSLSDDALSKPLSLIQAKQLVYRSSRPVARQISVKKGGAGGSCAGEDGSSSVCSSMSGWSPSASMLLDCHQDAGDVGAGLKFSPRIMSGGVSGSVSRCASVGRSPNQTAGSRTWIGAASSSFSARFSGSNSLPRMTLASGPSFPSSSPRSQARRSRTDDEPRAAGESTRFVLRETASG